MEDIKKIPVSKLKLGMKFDQPVFMDSYNVLFETGQAIKQKDLDLIEQWGIQELESHAKLLDLEYSSARGEKEKGPFPENTQKAPSPPSKSLFLRYESYYKSFRKTIPAFYRDLATNARLLEIAFKDFLVKKIPQAYHIEQIADFLVESILNSPLLIIFLRYTQFSKNWTLCHIMHSTVYGILLARAMEYSRIETRTLATAILTMDIGMFTIPSSIRDKYKKLNEEEVQAIKKHPILSHRLLYSGTNSKSSKVANIALQHHEAYDGSGYPRGLQGKNIDPDAMLAKICDNYSAMIEKRPFRKMFLPALALKNLFSSSGKRFDPDLLRIFAKTLSNYPLTSFVRLTDGRIGMVIASNPQAPNSPVIKLFRDAQRRRYNELQFVDIANESSLRIQEAVSPIPLGIDPIKEL